ncbi:MAG: hypothetical protein AB7F88_01715 [Pyrinomonadaceae bacterium]
MDRGICKLVSPLIANLGHPWADRHVLVWKHATPVSLDQLGREQLTDIKDILTMGFPFGRRAVLLLILCSPPILAQDPYRSPELIIWENWVNRLSDGVVDDAKSLANSEETFYLALLAKIWWKTDRAKAEELLRRSSGIAIDSLRTDDEKELDLSIKYFQKSLAVISGLDTGLGRRMLESFQKMTEERSVKNDQIADVFVTSARQLVSSDPQRAYDLGIRSLAFGTSLQLSRLIRDLNLREPRLSEQLFLITLNKAQQTQNIRLLSRLSGVAFSADNGNPQSMLVRRSFLQALANSIARGFNNPSEKKRACEFAIVASPLIKEFAQYLPGSSQSVTQQVQLCQASLPEMNAELSKMALDGETGVDELLKAASETKNRYLKEIYYSNAFAKMAQEEKYEEILSLLRAMPEDEVKLLGDDSLGGTVFDRWLREYSLDAAKQYFANKDFAALDRMLNRSEKRIRPFLRTNLVWDLPHQGQYGPFILENLEAARKELGSLEFSGAKRAQYFLTLTKLYIKVQPTEAESVFRELVKSINLADSENPDFVAEKDYAPLRDYIALPSRLLAIDEIGIFACLGDLSSRRSRVRLKLGLLESSLVDYSREKRASLEKIKVK